MSHGSLKHNLAVIVPGQRSASWNINVHKRRLSWTMSMSKGGVVTVIEEEFWLVLPAVALVGSVNASCLHDALQALEEAMAHGPLSAMEQWRYRGLANLSRVPWAMGPWP